MTDLPIIFSGPMVRALIDGHKTQTRRLLYVERKMRGGIVPASATMMNVIRNGREVALWPPLGSTPDHYFTLSSWQKVKPGDRLWVRENFSGQHRWSKMPPREWPVLSHIWYWADSDHPPDGDWTRPKPSIHMPRWASRLTLVVTATKVEPLRSIVEADARAEGVQHKELEPPGENHEFFIPIGNGELMTGWTARDTFANLWNYLHGAGSWHSNPEVIAISFKVYRKNIDAMEKAA